MEQNSPAVAHPITFFYSIYKISRIVTAPFLIHLYQPYLPEDQVYEMELGFWKHNDEARLFIVIKENGFYPDSHTKSRNYADV